MGDHGQAISRVLRFGAFELDLRAGELRKQGVRTRLQEQPLQVLLLLLARPGEVVTREELREKLWPADTFVDFEHGLNAAVKRLRDALGDSADSPRFIETLPRRGYRFLLPVDGPARETPPSSSTVVPEQAALFVPRWALAAALPLLLAAIALTWWVSRRPAVTSGALLTRLTSDSGLTTDPAVSPDGKLLAYASDRSGEGNLDIWVQQLTGGEAIRLTRNPADDHEPDFSADGTRIVFRSEREGGGIYVVTALGGEERVIAHQGRRPRFSPDGAEVVYWTGMGGDLVAPGTSKIYVVASTGGPPRQLRPEFVSARHPVWSPDGGRILFLGVREPNPGFLEARAGAWWVTPVHEGEPIETGVLSTLEAHRLTGSATPDRWVAGDRVLFSDRLGDSTNIWQIHLGSTTGHVAGAPERLTFGTGLETQPALAAGERLVFASHSENVDIWSLPVAADEGKVTGELERLTQSVASDYNPYLSANGRTLAFVSFKPNNGDVWVMDLESRKQTAVAATGSNEVWPIVSADGSRAAYVAAVSPDGISNPFYVVPARGGVPQKVCEGCGRLRDWSPDGTRLLYSYGQPRDVTVLNLETGRKTQILRHPQYNLYQSFFSPDGQWITFLEQTGPEHRRLYIVRFRDEAAIPESGWIPVTDGQFSDDKPRFSPDGKLLYFTSDRDGFMCLWAQRLEPATKRPSGAPFPVRHFHSARLSMAGVLLQWHDISVARDRIVLNLAELTGNIWMAQPEAGR
jgi:Tol biopolymer transport system component/DNA-binding winged helix-turn-helix (wHTH) protein